ncbi:MAG: hypothetical protein H6767_05325 [Candidatus Peribacteria bacterium]|nr:MAG: hypothetical protein H6767_05325 [Candidatus Peribacteria bacterium]
MKESKKQVAQLYLEVIAYQLVNKWKLEKGKFSYEFGKVYFNMTDYSEEVFPKTVADRDIVKNLEALGISMNALVKEANKRHESGDNAAPTVQGREVFPLPPQVQQ